MNTADYSRLWATHAPSAFASTSLRAPTSSRLDRLIAASLGSKQRPGSDYRRDLERAIRSRSPAKDSASSGT